MPGIKMSNRKILYLSVFLFSWIVFLQNVPSLAWTVSPVRFELKAERGKEYTLTFEVLNESQLYQKRFEVQTDDWVIDKNNNFLRKAFNKEVDNKYTATSWVKVTPQQFVVPPGQTKKIRFTVKIPIDLSSEGEYSTGIFVGEKNIEKPPKGEKIVHIKQDTFIGVVVYVRVGEEKQEVVLKDLKVETKPQEKGLNKTILLPVFESRGNVHARAEVKVKIEPLSQINLDVPKGFDAGEVVVLRESELAFPIDVPVSLPANSEWKFVVSADFGKHTPVLVGTKRYKVPFIEMPVAEKKQETKGTPASGRKPEEKKIEAKSQ